MIGENGFESMSWFMGYVEDNNDLNGRVKVRAFGFHPTLETDEVATEDLPWSFVIRNSNQYVPLNIGDMVVGFYMDGRDAQHPLVLGAINTGNYSAPYSGYTNQMVTGGYYNPSAPADGGTDNARRAYDYFISQGFTPAQAAGLVGNLQAESGPNLKIDAVGDSGQAYGIAQWHPDRQQDFANFAGKNIRSSTLDDQLAFIVYELKEGKEQGAYSKIRQAKTAGEAAELVDIFYERSSGAHRAKRAANAIQLHKEYGTGGLTDYLENAIENPNLMPSQDVVDKYGTPALPPQVTGEDLEFTPLLVQTATQRTATFSNGTSFSEPSPKSYGSVSETSVWQTRYGGSTITLSGKNTNDEFIDITHATGARVTLDAAGNVAIKGIGDLWLGSESGVLVDAGGQHLVKANSGYSLEVSGGKASIHVGGDMDIQASGNLTFAAGGKIVFNAGDTIDLAGTRIGIQARHDSVDIAAANKLSLHAEGGNININSEGGGILGKAKENFSIGAGKDILMKGNGRMSIGSSGRGIVSSGEVLALRGSDLVFSSSGSLGFGASGAVNIKGSTIHLNNPGYSAPSAGDPIDPTPPEASIKSGVGEPIEFKAGTENPFSQTGIGSSSHMVDDTE